MRYILLVLPIVLVSCSGNNIDAGKKILRYNETAGVNNLDPLFAERFEDIWVMSQIYNGLVRLDSTMEVVPDIATRWELDSSGTTYTFYLRSDVLFHDHSAFSKGKGRLVTAQDVVFSFHRILTPENGSQGQFIFRNTNADGIKALNDTTVSIRLNQRQNSFLKMLTLAFCYIVPEEAVDLYGKEFTRNPVGTGPFRFKIWNPGDKLVLEKNLSYFETDAAGNRLPYIDAVSVSFIRSAHTEFQQFLKGELDFMSGLNDSYQNALLTFDGTLKEKYAGRFYLLKQPWLKTDYIGILVDPSQSVSRESDLISRDVRIALNHAINRHNLVKNVRNGIGHPANQGFVPRGLNLYGDKQARGFEFSPELVRRHLFKAGFDGDSRKPRVKLTTEPDYKILCEYIVRDLNEMGFDAEIEIMLPSVHKQSIADFQTNFFRKSWTGDFPDPINFLKLYNSRSFAPDKGPNYTHFSDPEFDRLYQLAETTDSDSLRDACYLQMDQMVVDAAVTVPLFYDEIIKFVNKRITGLESNPMNQLNLKYVRIR